MHAQETGPEKARRASGVRSAAAPPGLVASASPEPRAEAMLALQGAAGNAMVSRMVELARHIHGPGCGHQEAETRTAEARTGASGTATAAGAEVDIQRASLANPGIGARSAQQLATGRRSNFDDATKGQVFQRSRHDRGQSRYHAAGVEVWFYKCGHCSKSFQEEDCQVDHVESWETLRANGFSRYKNDPSLYPVSNRSQEIQIYNDLDNLQLLCHVCNNRKSGSMSHTQSMMSVDWLADQGRYAPNKHVDNALIAGQVGQGAATAGPVFGSGLRLANPAIGSRSLSYPSTGQRSSDFDDATKKYLYTTYQVDQAQSLFHGHGTMVPRYKCAHCTKLFQQEECQIDHVESWETMRANGFSRYKNDPSLYPVSNRSQEIQIYNDLDNLQLLCHVCNNRKSGSMSHTQSMMSVDWLTDQGRWGYDKHA